MPTSKVVSYRNSTSNHNKDSPLYPIFELYLIEILHQTTTGRLNSVGRRSCILSKFYIKPQQAAVAYRCVGCCILSKFYIKPQLTRIRPYSAIVVSYRNSTSNHNEAAGGPADEPLYLIEILHQTTTVFCEIYSKAPLYLIEILHQTTTEWAVETHSKSCILSKFYIKPQPVYTKDH